MYVGETEASLANAPATHLGSSYNDAMGLSQSVESAIVRQELDVLQFLCMLKSYPSGPTMLSLYHFMHSASTPITPFLQHISDSPLTVNIREHTYLRILINRLIIDVMLLSGDHDTFLRLYGPATWLVRRLFLLSRASFI